MRSASPNAAGGDVAVDEIGLLSDRVSMLGADGVWNPLLLVHQGLAQQQEQQPYQGWALPAMPAVVEPVGTPLQLPAHSYVFSILTGYGADACPADS